MADRTTIKAGIWSCIVEEWNSGNFDRARSLERFLTALEERERAEPYEAGAAVNRSSDDRED
jgi:hypothetical protein